MVCRKLRFISHASDYDCKVYNMTDDDDWQQMNKELLVQLMKI